MKILSETLRFQYTPGFLVSTPLDNLSVHPWISCREELSLSLLSPTGNGICYQLTILGMTDQQQQLCQSSERILKLFQPPPLQRFPGF